MPLNKNGDISRDVLVQRIFRLKVWHASVVLIALGLLFFTLENLVPHAIPLRSIADACFIAGVVGLTYEWFVRKEAREELRHILTESLILQ